MGYKHYKGKHKEFLAKIKFIPETQCWEWQGQKNSNGYGRIEVNNRQTGAHRYSYKYYIGEIPDNLMVLHDCDNKICCSPFHIHKGDGLLNHKEARERGLRPSGAHPSQKTYKEGCRCDECKKLHSERGMIYRKKKKLSNLGK